MNAVTTTSGRLTWRQGNEGPKYDPYGYTELTLEKNGRTYVVHMGLALWFKVDKIKIDLCEPEQVERMLKTWTGYTPMELERWMWRAIGRRRSKCPKCGGPIECADGYPGETVYYCPAGHGIVDADQNMSDFE